MKTKGHGQKTAYQNDTQNVETADALAKEHGVSPATIKRDGAKAWIIRNQLGRRNLPPYQRAELALALEPLIAKKAKENLKTSTGGTNPQPSQNSVKPVDRQKELAKLAQMSHDTLHKAKVIKEKADEPTKAKLRAGETGIFSFHRNA